MKPCFTKRKLIAWLALGELDAPRAKPSARIFETCAPCRRYLAELSAVTDRLAAPRPEPNLETSASFHRSLVRRLSDPVLRFPLGDSCPCG